jgi:hypothetical protein
MRDILGIAVAVVIALLAQIVDPWSGPWWVGMTLSSAIALLVVVHLLWRGLKRPIKWGWRPLKLFLETDSVSDQYGVHTFSDEKYIQLSATATRFLTKCRAWIDKIEYDPDGAAFSKEHGERVQCPLVATQRLRNQNKTR